MERRDKKKKFIPEIYTKPDDEQGRSGGGLPSTIPSPLKGLIFITFPKLSFALIRSHEEGFEPIIRATRFTFVEIIFF